MVDLARQAFSANNFELAAEIYERAIRENGPQTDLYLGLADSFAKGGQFCKAFESYTKAFRTGKVTPEKLQHLVTALIDSVNSDSFSSSSRGSTTKCYMFTCWICRGLLNEPLTTPCGHTFCRTCLEKDKTTTCKICGVVHYRLKLASIKANVVLSCVIRKWFGNESKAAKLKVEGNKFFERRDFNSAIKAYSEALILCDTDHLSLSNRSHAFAAIDRFEDALADAEKVVKLRPDWPKGFFRKGAALYGIGRYEDAVVAFLQCLALDKDVASAREFLSKSFHMMLSQLPPDDPKNLERQKEHSPSVFQTLLSNNFNMVSFLPHFTTTTLGELHRIMEDTVNVAASTDSAVASCALSEKGTGDENDLQMTMEKQQDFSSTASFLSDTEQRHSEYRYPDCRKTSTSETPKCRKRSHHSSSTMPVSPTHSCPKTFLKSGSETATADKKEISSTLLNLDDFECALCYRIFYQPVTTPCGHVFCRACLDRCLDHQVSCPMCKSCLAEYLAERRQVVTEAIQAILVTYFGKEYAERQKIHEEEVTELAQMGADNQHEIPVFVCTLSFPTVPCPLHIFEPRYRLMMRQCMESGSRQFGMCIPVSQAEGDFSDFGCMLEIRDVHFFPDGRSLVNTVGGRRFKVISRGKRDGYNTARVEFLSDKMLEEETHGVKTLQNEVYTQLQDWLSTVPAAHSSRITEHFGSLPSVEPNLGSLSNGPAWVWWAVAVLPIDARVQLTMLALTSLKERLLALQKVLRYLSSRRGR